MVWVVFAFLTGAAVLAVLWPLSRAPRVSMREEADKDFYRAAVADIDRDLGRGLIAPADAEAAKTEAARRLLAAAGEQTKRDVSRARARGAALATLILVPALSIGLYRQLGEPDYPDQPLEARLNAPPAEMDVNAALAKIEKHLADEPDDARGWEIVAPVYMKLGRAREAAEAFRNQIRLLGPNAERASAFGEALTFAANGAVTPQARAAFEAALADDETHPRARFFVALADEQAGERDRALEGYTRLLRDAPPDAPWLDVVRERIARLGADAPKAAPGAAEAIAAMPADQRDQTIRGMVAGLAARLAQNGADPEGWQRLVRAYTVLRELEKARAALFDARKALDGDAGALQQLDQLASELGLGG